MTRRVLLLVLASCLAGAIAWSNAQDENYVRIARLSYVEGHVSFQHSSDVDWSAASVNLPIEPGDRIYTGTDGRAEIQFDDGSAFRMAENSDVEFMSLKQDLIQLRMLLGLTTLNATGGADFEIDTPAAAFNTLRDGVYRFDVVENGDTDAIVRKGELEAANNQFSRRLQAGDLLHVLPGDGNPRVSLYERRDAWDEWNDRRNADFQVYGNQRYLPDNVYVGAADLYRYGRWMNVDSYGVGWVPSVLDADWAPYSLGRWCYRPFYGWTWISYEPWGWLPYHYGRWYRSSMYGWCWLPGPAYGFNFWAPSLVTFYYGPNWVSWCPLGPGDYYDIRNYHYNHGIYSQQLAELQRLNTRGVGDPFNRYVPGAFRTAQLERFRDGSFDNVRQTTRWGNIDRPWSQGTLARDRLDIKPTTSSFSAVTGRVAVRPGARSDRPTVVRSVPERGTTAPERLTRITNPQIPSIPPRNMRAREEAGSDNRNASQSNTRVIQAPSVRSGSSPANQENRRMETPRGPVQRPSGEQNIRGGGGDPRAVPQTQDQSSRQNPPRQRNERTTPEKKTAPQRAPEARPSSSEPRQQSNYKERWSDSNRASSGPAEVRIAPSYNPPRNEGRQGWNDSNRASSGPAEVRIAPSYNPPRNEGRQAWNESNRASTGPTEVRIAPSYSPPRNEGSQRWSAPQVTRAPDYGRSQSYSAPAPRASSPSVGSFRSAPAPSPSQGNFGGEARRSSEGNSGRHR